jgi:aspartokinase-like uncharacterized kinase
MTAWVVKLGGSLANSDELPKWLDVIAATGAGRVVLVPGGGPWADAVREAQKQEGFDDRTAHRKALRAMEQFAEVLAGMRPEIIPAASIAQLDEILGNDRIPVWMPYDMVVAEPVISESWNVTSDSLAAWLARRLNVATLLLVKSLEIRGVQPEIEELVRRGWVDAAFAEFALDQKFRVLLLGAGNHDVAERLLSSAHAATAANGI